MSICLEDIINVLNLSCCDIEPQHNCTTSCKQCIAEDLMKLVAEDNKNSLKQLIQDIVINSDKKKELVGDCNETEYVTYYIIGDYKIVELAKKYGVELRQ